LPAFESAVAGQKSQQTTKKHRKKRCSFYLSQRVYINCPRLKAGACSSLRETGEHKGC